MGKYDLNRLRSLHKLDDMTALLREEYPKLDKPLLSKCMNDGYGVQLKPEALRTLGQRFDPDGWENRREKDRHKLKDSVRVRLTRRELEDFSFYYRRDGYTDAAACLRELIRKYVQGWMCRDLIEEERREREKELWRNLTEEEYPEE